MLKNFKPRLYQETILGTAMNHNTLVVLPTGLGKTNCAIMLSAQRLTQYPESKIVFVAPTKPLVEQHFQSYTKYFDISPEKLTIFTGEIAPEKRAGLWQSSTIIFSTPQSLENDLLGNKINLNNVSLLIVDEAHRAVKDYSYVWLAEQYQKNARFPRILALTASPGSDTESITIVCKNLFIEEIEMRSDHDPDVEPYIQQIKTEFISVELPQEMKQIKKYLNDSLKQKIHEIKNYGFWQNQPLQSRKDLLTLQANLHGSLAKGDKSFEVLKSLSLAAEAMKVYHAEELLESQCISSLNSYLEGIITNAEKSKVKATQNLAKDTNFRSAAFKTRLYFMQGNEHPKLTVLKEIIVKKVQHTPSAKIIIFSQYRDTISKIVEDINTVEGVHAKIFVGQAKKKQTGMSQKLQIKILDEFREGLFNVLVASSVGEEGLDIPAVDEVIFYESVPSAIRHIQRRGRTGRLARGTVKILVAKGTRDEAYRWSSHHKEKTMVHSLKDMKTNVFKSFQKESTLLPYQSDEKVQIFADAREGGSQVLRALVNNNVQLRLQSLPVGDFIVSGRCCIEYKNTEDFVQSLIDGRLLVQIRNMKQQYERPLIIVEGIEDIYAMRNVHANAIRGMIATITVSYGIPIIYTKNAVDTAQMIEVIARREQLETGKEFSLHGTKPTSSLQEQQEYLVSSLPGIGPGLAKDILTHFKTVKRIVNATEKELKEVEKIGDIKAKKLKEISECEYSTVS